jgi:hypothetical protein
MIGPDVGATDAAMNRAVSHGHGTNTVGILPHASQRHRATTPTPAPKEFSQRRGTTQHCQPVAIPPPLPVRSIRFPLAAEPSHFLALMRLRRRRGLPATGFAGVVFAGVVLWFWFVSGCGSFID